MKINKGIKQINLKNKEKKPIILSITDRRKITITKNKRKVNNEDKTYYSYQLNIPKDFILLMQDAYEYGDPKKGNYTMHLLEIHKQHYLIKLAPHDINSIMTLLPKYQFFNKNTINTLIKKANITEKQAYHIIEIIENEQTRNEPKIAETINKNVGIDTEEAYKIYQLYREAELKSVKNLHLTLPKKDMAYLQAYDNLIEITEKVNKEIELHNKLVDNDKDRQELFKVPKLYYDLFFYQKFNIEYLHFEYELHIRIKADVDDAFVDYVKNDAANPGGVPGWLETLIIDWDDPAVQRLLGIDAAEKDYDLHKLAMDKPILDIDKLLDNKENIISN